VIHLIKIQFAAGKQVGKFAIRREAIPGHLKISIGNDEIAGINNGHIRIAGRNSADAW
jgi:hypothetical protein